MRSAVCAALACTVAELERWAKAGRLEPLYTRRAQIEAAGRTVHGVRFWAKEDVQAAQAQVEQWRASDLATPRRARRSVA